MDNDDIKYNKAPVSELIFGITLKEGLLNKNNYIYELLSQYKNDYPNIQSLPPIPDEEFDGYREIRSISPSKAGNLYRMRTSDDRWLIQFQPNKIYFNWVRKDDEDVGKFPGYTETYRKFEHILEEIANGVKQELPVKYYDLTYQDRIFWEDYIDNFSNLKKILNLQIPSLALEESSFAPKNIMFQYAFPVVDIGGYAQVVIQSYPLTNGKHIISYQPALRGVVEGWSRDQWFTYAHRIQLKMFVDIFNKEMLEAWK